MFCSPLIQPEPTRIPGPVRALVGTWLGGTPRPRRQTVRKQSCLYTTGRIGDFVLTLSALRLLLRELGPGNCSLVVPDNCAELAAREFPGVHLFPLPPDGPGLVRDILPVWHRQRGQFADFHFARRIALRHQRTLYHEVTLSWISADQDFRLTRADYPAIPAEDLCTELLAHRRLVGQVLGRPVTREEILPGFATYPVSSDGRLLVYPLSSQAERCLPPSWVATVLQKWRERRPARVVFGGGPGDRSRLEPYVTAARTAGLDDPTIELPEGVDGFIRHVAAAGAVFATESAAAHIATALDKPTVVATGGGIHGLCYPWRRSARQHAIVNPLPCFGCDWRCTQSEMFCLTGLPADEAAAALSVI